MSTYACLIHMSDTCPIHVSIQFFHVDRHMSTHVSEHLSINRHMHMSTRMPRHISRRLLHHVYRCFHTHMAMVACCLHFSMGLHIAQGRWTVVGVDQRTEAITDRVFTFACQHTKDLPSYIERYSSSTTAHHCSTHHCVNCETVTF